MKVGMILAGGIGRRMGGIGTPKQYLMLGEKPIIIHTVEAFVLHPGIDRVLIGVPAAWIEHTQHLLTRYLPDVETIDVIEGGEDRNGTILNGCRYVQTVLQAPDAIMVTHDAVRPFITPRIISENLAAIKPGCAVDTVIGATDTIIVSKDDQTIDSIPLRKHMYQGQTPQSFVAADFVSLYEKTDAQNLATLSDACKLFLLHERPVYLVQGEVWNIKVTTGFDLSLAAAILEARHD